MVNFKKIVLLFLTVGMILSLFSGCGKQTVSEKKLDYDPKKYPAYVNPDGYKFSTYPTELTVWVNSPQSMNGSWGDDDVSAWIKSTLNIDLKISYANTSNSEELTTMLLTNEKLPDLIVADPYSSICRQLIQQKYVASLDEVAKKYYPDFLKILPGGMQTVYTQDDGHFYNTAAWYADTDRILKYRKDNNLQAGSGDQSVCLNRTYYEGIGSPPVDTPEQLFNAIVSMKAKYPAITMPAVPYFIKWDHSKDTVNMFYRMYGGEDWLYDDGSGNIKICVGDPRYKQALAMLNKMYRSGLFTKESLSGSYDIITNNLRSEKVFAYFGQDWQWFSLIRDGDKKGSSVLPIQFPAAVPRDQLKLNDFQLSSVGGNPGVFISADSKNKQRAIEYLAFRYTDESQIAERFGIEGKSWEKDPKNNQIMWTKEAKAYELENGWQAASEKYGYNDGVHCWFTGIYSTVLESENSRYYIQQYNGSLNSKYMVNERIYDLTKIIRDKDTQSLYDQFVKAANESVLKCIQAGSEAAFEKEYSSYLSLAKQSNQSQLEAYYTKQYKEWKKKGFN